MSVLSCDRKGCDRIMCDTYIPEIGYICNECKSEFKEYLGSKDLDATEMNRNELIHELKHFMEKIQKGSQERISVDSFFEEHTKSW